MMKSPTLRILSGTLLLAAFTSFGPLASADTVITESAGTISEFSPDALVIHSEVASAPTRYVVRRDVTYVDDAGAPVTVDVVKSGLPVTVHYVHEGDQVVARRVVVHRRAAVVESRPSTVIETRPAPVIQERRTVEVVPAPAPAVVEERRTTTTTTTTGK